ncbi:uncharacterized protein LOC143040887 [Oratosquilla oratoria]|uniref:uncharacterized protein LOC143040887 n=1 Tax=Oratosquilla oratoria TaxID=337810 RepID=UPI003F7600EA
MRSLTVLCAFLAFLSLWTIAVQANNSGCRGKQVCTEKSKCADRVLVEKECGTDKICCQERESGQRKDKQEQSLTKQEENQIKQEQKQTKQGPKRMKEGQGNLRKSKYSNEEKKEVDCDTSTTYCSKVCNRRDNILGQCNKKKKCCGCRSKGKCNLPKKCTPKPKRCVAGTIIDKACKNNDDCTCCLTDECEPSSTACKDKYGLCQPSCNKRDTEENVRCTGGCVCCTCTPKKNKCLYPKKCVYDRSLCMPDTIEAKGCKNKRSCTCCTPIDLSTTTESTSTTTTTTSTSTTTESTSTTITTKG